MNTDAHRHCTKHSDADGQRWEWVEAYGCPRAQAVGNRRTEFVFRDGSRVVTTFEAWDFGVHESRIRTVQGVLDAITDDRQDGFGCDARQIWPSSSHAYDRAWIDAPAP